MKIMTLLKEKLPEDKEAKVAIMEIERFAIHDGPGIRTTVFMKGCPLRCQWCANPESQEISKLLMHYPRKCGGCGKCFAICQNGAIKWKENNPFFVRNKCTCCGKCGDGCMQEAIVFSGIEMKIGAIMDEVLRDKEYYDASGGGITLSGGEPFLQFQGALELLKESKKNHLHTVVETCGYVNQKHLKEALPFVDLFLFDIKHIDAKKFETFTGGDMSVVLTNMEWLADKVPDKIIPRIPIVPGFNHSKKEIADIFTFIKANGLKQVCLLPYHTWGCDKYEQLGIAYQLAGVESLPKEALLEYVEMGTQMNLKVQVGG